MTKVSLRVYNREIEGMIESSQLDEAIAHCQQTLKTFPMYIETYRLLGKAFLEARRYTDAADIFQRVLMTVPDDFVAHVGMSIIRDDEGKLDDAIWHMERAFEVQPSNSAIQNELRRLYGRRDGVEPPKIRLSRDALANMYSQGELFNQAIAEIRAVLADDPNRPDLQVMLARANYRAGQKVEAAEMAAALLKKYPYCLDALRVMVDVLPGTSQSENIQIYRHRLEMLDPYSSFVSDSVFASDKVADTAVSLERLDYKSGGIPASSQPGWASSLGIQLAGEKQAESSPEWVYTAEAQGQPAPAAPVESAATPEPAGSAPEPAAADNSIPEWMRSAGWQESSGSNEAAPADFNQEPPAEPIAQAEIPDWLKSMAPPEVTEKENVAAAGAVESQPDTGEGIPDWLKTMAPEAVASAGIVGAELTPETPPAGQEPEPAKADEIPDWLNSLTPSAAASAGNAGNEPSPTTPPAIPEAEPAKAGEVPDWLNSLTPTEAGAGSAQNGASPETPPAGQEPEPAKADEIPDWLKSMAPESAKSAENAGPESPTGAELPDWLTGLGGGTEKAGTEQVENEPAPIEASPVEVEPEAPKSEESPVWLQSTPSVTSTGAENKGVESSTAETPFANVEPEPSKGEEFPDWLKSISPTESSAGPKVEKEPSPAAGVGGAPLNIESEPAANSEFPDWLKSLDKGEEVGKTAEAGKIETPQPEQMPTAEQPAPANISPSEEQPVIGQPLQQEPIAKEPIPPVPSTVSSGESLPTGTEKTKPLTIEDDTLGWLESLAAKQGAKPEELLTKPQERSVEMPDWLRETKALTPMEVAPESKNIPQQVLPNEPTPTPIEESASAPAPSAEEIVPEVGGALPPQPQEEVAKPVTIEDDTMAWLERLAANQGAKPEELLTKAGERPETTPEWIQAASVEKPEAPAETPVSTIPEAPTETPASTISEAPAETPISAIPEAPAETPTSAIPEVAEPASALSEEDISITSWLNKLDKTEVAPVTPAIEPAEEGTEAAHKELPDWLKGIEEPTLSTTAAEPENEMPDWLRQPVQPVEKEQVQQTPEPERLPKQATEPETLPKQAPEPEMPSWMEEAEGNAELVTPTAPEEWVPVEATAPGPQITSTYEAEPKTEPVQSMGETPVTPPVNKSGMLAQIPAHNKDAESLSTAQKALDNNSLTEAMQEYGKLIKKGRLLDETIHDLREAIYRFPVDVIVWQTLGDAYMRANRLQDALDAYTKAEELLR